MKMKTLLYDDIINENEDFITSFTCCMKMKKSSHERIDVVVC